MFCKGLTYYVKEWFFFFPKQNLHPIIWFMNERLHWESSIFWLIQFLAQHFFHAIICNALFSLLFQMTNKKGFIFSLLFPQQNILWPNNSNIDKLAYNFLHGYLLTLWAYLLPRSSAEPLIEPKGCYPVSRLGESKLD